MSIVQVFMNPRLRTSIPKGVLQQTMYGKGPDEPSCSFGASFICSRFRVCFVLSGPGALQTSSGTCSNAYGFFSSILHVKMGKTIAQSIRSELVVSFSIVAVIFASPSGKVHFRKTHPTRKTKSLTHYRLCKQQNYS